MTTTGSAVDLLVPNLGESVTEATIAQWVMNDGTAVKAGDVVAELETDKATVELPANAAGILRHRAAKGATVAVGQVIAQIQAGEVASTAAPQVTSATAVTVGHELAPSVQRLVSEHQLDPAQIAASGKDGRITKGDVLDYLAKTGPSQPVDSAAAAASQKARQQPPREPLTTVGTTTVYNPPARAADGAAGTPASGDNETRVELSKLRQTMARRLVESQHATASLTTFNEVDLSAVMQLRAKYKDMFEKTHGVGLGFMSFFARAVCRAITYVPAINARLDGSALVYLKAVHLGVAVSTEKGLIVPVVRNANLLSMPEIEAEIKRLATRAREGKITVDEMAGGTFTITNGGVFGSLLSTPILNPPQAAILGMHKIEKRPVVVEGPGGGGGDQIVIKPMMYTALTYDHRIIDGQQSVTFLVKVKEALEDPARMLMEV